MVAREGLRLEERVGDSPQPRIDIGVWVKVGLCDERFWVRVVRWRTDGAFEASVENNLERSTLRVDDEVVVEMRHVLETADEHDALAFHRLACFLGPEKGALSWLAARSKHGVSAQAKPNARRVVLGLPMCVYEEA